MAWREQGSLRTAPEQQNAATPLMSTRAAVYELGDQLDLQRLVVLIELVEYRRGR